MIDDRDLESESDAVKVDATPLTTRLGKVPSEKWYSA
jgi:hypothetical protein